jgi:transcriptional regulator with XRE-family HTH domain
MSMDKTTAAQEKFTDHQLREWRKSHSWDEESGEFIAKPEDPAEAVKLPHVSLGQLAEQLDITTAHLSQIEHRKGRCSFDLALKLAEITGLPVQDFHLPK